uniref:Uncharacterized protein n=1 Tax=Triticum urartu TaxID=4572 RepID=A0A8R7QSY2_TRIUA
MSDRDDRLKICLGNGPVNLLFENVAKVISDSLPRLGGSGPSNMLPSVHIISSCVKFPREDGMNPVSRLWLNTRYCSEFSLPMVSGKAPVNWLPDSCN